MEGAIGDAEQRFRLRIVSVLAVTFKERQSCDKITFLQEVIGIWQPKLFLLLLKNKRVC